MYIRNKVLETLKLQESQFTRAPYMSNRVVSEERVVAYSAEFVTDSASLAMAAARSGLIREGGRGQVGLQLSLPWNFLVCLGGVREGGRSRGQVCRVGHHHRSGRSRGELCRVVITGAAAAPLPKLRLEYVERALCVVAARFHDDPWRLRSHDDPRVQR